MLRPLLFSLHRELHESLKMKDYSALEVRFMCWCTSFIHRPLPLTASSMESNQENIITCHSSQCHSMCSHLFLQFGFCIFDFNKQQAFHIW